VNANGRPRGLEPMPYSTGGSIRLKSEVTARALDKVCVFAYPLEIWDPRRGTGPGGDGWI
jgi:hypothetical protein